MVSIKIYYEKIINYPSVNVIVLACINLLYFIGFTTSQESVITEYFSTVLRGPLSKPPNT